jgi:hypothetical protein
MSINFRFYKSHNLRTDSITQDDTWIPMYFGPSGVDYNFFQASRTSYEGYDWESSSGEFSSLKLTYNVVSCMVNLPSLPQGCFYHLTSSQSSDVATGPSNQYVRFLEQTSFGGNWEQISWVNHMPHDRVRYHIAEWLKIQILSSDITPHRVIFRQRINSRMR